MILSSSNDLLVGSIYGKWTVIAFSGRDIKSNQLYLCRCECGTEKIQRKSAIVDKKSLMCKSCSVNDRYGYSDDIIGKRFGNCVVLSSLESQRKQRVFLVQCDCGIQRKALGYKLKEGKGTKCPHCRIKTHGMSYTSTFRIWTGILRRCFNKNFSHYKYYGGRGITVSDHWLKFENFLEDMGIRPDNLQIDRINNDGNYEPGNCRWVTAKVNNANRPIVRKGKL